MSNSVDEAIDYLTTKKFGVLIITLAPTFANTEHYKNSNFSKQATEIEEYKNSLRKMPTNELLLLHQQSLTNDSKRASQHAINEDKNRFYNLESANADFVHWSKAAHWSIDEAIALSFGKEPEYVTWKKIEPLKDKTKFAKEFSKRRDLAMRATRWKQFASTIPPLIFIDWAKQLRIELPQELLSELASIGCTATNWRERYQALKIMNNDSANKLLQKPESVRKVDNLLQAITCIAIDSYRYDHKQEKSNVPQQISDDISKCGKTIDTKTIRGWLKEGLALLPAKPHKD